MSMTHDPYTLPANAVHAELASLAAVLDLRDPEGILSLYASRSDASAPGRDRLERRVRELFAGWPVDPDTRDRAFAELERRLGDAPAPEGRALFLGLATGRAVDVRLPAPVDLYATVDRMAHVAPLLAVGWRTRPAGLVVVSASRLEAFELRGLSLRELDAVDLSAGDRAWRTRRGRPGAPSAPARQPGPGRDLHLRRRRDRLAAAATTFGERAGLLAEARRWDLVLLGGSRRLAAHFARRFPTWRSELVELPSALGRLETRELPARVFAEVTRRRDEHTAEAVAAASGSPDTIWGEDAVLAALLKGRVGELLIEDDLEPGAAEALVRGALATAAEHRPVRAGEMGWPRVAGRPRW